MFMSVPNAIIKFSESKKLVILDISELFSISNDATSATCTLGSGITAGTLQKIESNGFSVNGVKVDSSTSVVIERSDATDFIFTLMFDNYQVESDLQFTLDFSVAADDPQTYTATCYAQKNVISEYKFYDKTSEMIASNMESFMLLRTNPKLTGNVKLVVTEDSKLYLDSFKVSSTSVLNNMNYRHQEVSADGNYAYDIYKVFGDVPVGEMYSIYPDSLNPQKNRYDLFDQIENIYEYGAEFNADALYSENMKLLAPLYIGKHLPTYFAIFRTPRLFTENYNISSKEIFSDMLKDSKVIKIFDLRQSTTIGKYLNNYKDDVDAYLSGVCNLQFIEQENKGDKDNYRQGRNSWKGIEYTKGILSESTETSYFGSKIIDSKSCVQEKYDMFLVNGFSRNNLLYPNIINLEFMFNDEEAADFQMYNYFGLYLTENAFQVFNQVYSTTNAAGNKDIVYVDDSNNISAAPFQKLENVMNDSNYADRIFFMSTLNKAAALKTIDDAYVFVKSNVVNQPYENIVQISGVERTFESTEKAFLTLHFTQQIQAGEHFRFIISKDKKQGIQKYTVLEIIASQDRRLLEHADCISPFISTNTAQYAYSDDNDTEIYRLNFYAGTEESEYEAAPIEIQLDRLSKCISKFDSFIYVLDFQNDAISFISNYEHTVFQHITADNINGSKYSAVPYKEDYIHYFNCNNTVYCSKLSNLTDRYKTEYLKYSLSGLETLGNRYSSVVKFINTSAYNGKDIYEIEKDLYKQLQNILYPLVSVDASEMYSPLVKHVIEEGEFTYSDETSIGSMLVKSYYEYFCTIASPFNVKHSMIVSNYPARSVNGMINICTPLKANVSIMGINSIKDIFSYIDHSKIMKKSTATSASFKKGERVAYDNSDVRLRKFVAYRLVYGSIKNMPLSSDTVFVIVSDSIYYSINGGVTQTVSLKDSFIEFAEDTVIELSNDSMLEKYDYSTATPMWKERNFFNNPSDREKLYKSSIGNFSLQGSLDIPIIPAVNCNWKSNGQYFDFNSFLNTSDLSKYEVTGNFIQNVYSPATDARSQYIVNKLSDVVDFKGSNISIRDLITSNSYHGAIKKYLVTNFKLDTAIGFYNASIQTLDFIYYGIKFTLKLTNSQYANDIRLNECNNYEIFIMNDYTDQPNEIFISRDEQFILMINHKYNGTDRYKDDSIKYVKNGIEDASYTWSNAPYNYSIIYTAYENSKYYFKKNKQITLDTNIDYMVEFDLPEYNAGQAFEEKAVYCYLCTLNTAFESNNSYDVLNTNAFVIGQAAPKTVGGAYEFDQNYSTLSSIYSGAYGIDFRTKHTYALCKDRQTVNTLTASDKLNRYISSIENADVDMYFISANSTTKLQITDSYKPLIITLSKPNNIKYNYGLFNVAFNDIFEFESQDSISSSLGLDTLYANTCIKSINSIPSYYYWKIMKSNKLCNLNYFKVANRNVCSTDWDVNIYRLYDDNVKFSYQPGYATGITDKMFFASKCLNIHGDNIQLNNWESGNSTCKTSISKQNDMTFAADTFSITLNISDAFESNIINNNTFRNNWIANSADAQFNTYLNNYVKHTILGYYDFDNIEVELYCKYEATAATDVKECFTMQMPEDFEAYTQIYNFKTDLKKISGSIQLTINIAEDYTHYKYYPIIKISKHL